MSVLLDTSVLIRSGGSLDLDPEESRYGELRAASGSRPTNDLWTAATALAGGLTLITADEQQAALPLVVSRLVG